MSLPRGHVAKPLHDALDPESYRIVCDYLRDVAADHALEADGKVISPSVGWLAEALSFYDPPSCAYPFGQDGPKMVRETLCVAQAAIRDRDVCDGRTDEHCARIGRLIDICDVHRPIGPNGKHGDRHTPTCGCEDKPGEDWTNWPAPRDRNAWKKGVRDEWKPWLDALPDGTTVLASGAAYWTKGAGQNPLGGDVWTSGFNHVSTIVLLRLYDSFIVADDESSGLPDPVPSGDEPCPICNDDGVVHTHDGLPLGPCDCAVPSSDEEPTPPQRDEHGHLTHCLLCGRAHPCPIAAHAAYARLWGDLGRTEDEEDR